MWDSFIDGLKDTIHSRKGKPPELSINSLPQLNSMLWGIQKEKLTIIAARPSQGKSAFIRQITLDMVRSQKNGIVFSWEETKENFMQNLASSYGLVKNFDMVTGNIGEKHEQSLIGLKRLLSNANLAIIESRGKTVDDFVRLVQKPKKLDYVIVDYINLVKSKGSSDKEALDEFIHTARELAKDRYYNMREDEFAPQRAKRGITDERYPCAVILACQINRGTVISKQVTPPLMSEIKGCVHGDTLIGGKRIYDIINIGEHIEVDSVGGKRKTTDLIDTGMLPCLKITTRSGKSIILSKCTPLYTDKWTPAERISVGDKIYVKKV